MSQTENIAASAAKLSSSWRDEVNQIRTRLILCALDLLDSYEEICEYCENEGEPIPELCEKTLLNGATNWDSYCYGGFALIYDEDIAKALCTPSELKRTNSGRNDPNPRETWTDVQARAYFQAYRRLINCA